jgi:ABC-2 type transport system permease protein
MPAPEMTGGALAARRPGQARAVSGQFPTATRFAIRTQARNRLAAILLVAFVPAWYLLMMTLAGHTPLTFRLFATGQVLTVDGGQLTLISAGLNALTIITGFAVFHAVHTTLGFDRRLVFAGYRQATLIAAKILATSVLAVAVALYAGLVLLAFWRPGPAGWLAITAGYAVMAVTYGALGLLLGVLVRGDLEGFFLIIMGGLMDTFLQNPLGNPLANKPILEWFPSFGPMQFAVGGAFGHTWLASHLLLGLAWAAALALAGLIIFRIRTRSHTR